jgi:hypothetical protein
MGCDFKDNGYCAQDGDNVDPDDKSVIYKCCSWDKCNNARTIAASGMFIVASLVVSLSIGIFDTRL